MDKDGASDCICGNARWVLKILVGAVILVCFVSILSIATVSPNGVTMVELEPHAGSIRLDHHLVYVSKRRVPNGPDPIHNRRVGESRRPPGRA